MCRCVISSQVLYHHLYKARPSETHHKQEAQLFSLGPCCTSFLFTVLVTERNIFTLQFFFLFSMTSTQEKKARDIIQCSFTSTIVFSVSNNPVIIKKKNYLHFTQRSQVIQPTVEKPRLEPHLSGSRSPSLFQNPDRLLLVAQNPTPHPLFSQTFSLITLEVGVLLKSL